jgi:hypothetical protein
MTVCRQLSRKLSRYISFFPSSRHVVLVISWLLCFSVSFSQILFLGKFFVREMMWRVQVFMQDRRSKDDHLHSRPQDVMMD